MVGMTPTTQTGSARTAESLPLTERPLLVVPIPPSPVKNADGNPVMDRADQMTMTPAEIKALVERLEEEMRHRIAQHGDRPDAPTYRAAWHEAFLLFRDTSLRSFMDGGWRPIAEYEGCGPALVSTAPHSRRELFSEPVSAFRDVTGVWRCLGSIGGMAELSCQPTHFRPLPTPPAVEGEAGE